MMMRSKPYPSSTSATSRVVAARPPNEPRVAIERMNTPGSRATLSIRTRSPRSAPPVKGDVGSTAITPTLRPASRYVFTSSAVMVLLPAPGGPVSPIRRARPVRECSDERICSKPSRWFSTMLTTRARAADFPASKPASSFSDDTRENPLLPAPHLRLGARRSVRMLVAEHMEGPVNHEAEDLLSSHYTLPTRVVAGDLRTDINISNDGAALSDSSQAKRD